MFNDATRTICGHTFCKKCIERQIENKGLCPACSKPLDLKQLIEAKSIKCVVKEFKVAQEAFEHACNLDLAEVPIQYLPKQGLPAQSISNCNYK